MYYIRFLREKIKANVAAFRTDLGKIKEKLMYTLVSWKIRFLMGSLLALSSFRIRSDHFSMKSKQKHDKYCSMSDLKHFSPYVRFCTQIHQKHRKMSASDIETCQMWHRKMSDLDIRKMSAHDPWTIPMFDQAIYFIWSYFNPLHFISYREVCYALRSLCCVPFQKHVQAFYHVRWLVSVYYRGILLVI